LNENDKLMNLGEIWFKIFVGLKIRKPLPSVTAR
jgi:hypothetical protein